MNRHHIAALVIGLVVALRLLAASVLAWWLCRELDGTAGFGLRLAAALAVAWLCLWFGRLLRLRGF